MRSGPSKVVKTLLAAAALALVGYVYGGFFRVDPLVWVQMARYAQVIVWGARLGMPLVALAGLVLWLKRGKHPLHAADVAVFAGSLVLLALVAYPVLNYLQHRKFDGGRLLERFHPYLQLAPNPLPEQALGDRRDFRIFCLGGSTTEFKDSAGVGWPQRLEKRLQAHFGSERIKVYNLGRQWYTTLHSLINYEANLRKHRPDVILVMHAVNDLLHNADFCYFSHGSFREDYGHFYGPVNNLVTHQTIEQKLWDALSRMWYFKPRAVVEQRDFPGLAPFERNLETLIDLARADGARVVLMTQPSLYKADITTEEKAALYMLNYEAVGPDRQWSYASARRGFQQYNARVKEIARRQQVDLIELDGAVKKDLAHFSDDVHYRDPTFDIIADFLSRRIVDLGLVAGTAAGGDGGGR